MAQVSHVVTLICIVEKTDLDSVLAVKLKQVPAENNITLGASASNMKSSQRENGEKQAHGHPLFLLFCLCACALVHALLLCLHSLFSHHHTRLLKAGT